MIRIRRAEKMSKSDEMTLDLRCSKWIQLNDYLLINLQILLSSLSDLVTGFSFHCNC